MFLSLLSLSLPLSPSFLVVSCQVHPSSMEVHVTFVLCLLGGVHDQPRVSLSYSTTQTHTLEHFASVKRHSTDCEWCDSERVERRRGGEERGSMYWSECNLLKIEYPSSLQVMYQVGVLISRSSVSLFHFKWFWILSILQVRDKINNYYSRFFNTFHY